MRCARCGRMLLRPGVPVSIAGGEVIAGPKCADLMKYGELGRPTRASVMRRAPRRARPTPQIPLFEASA